MTKRLSSVLLALAIAGIGFATAALGSEAASVRGRVVDASTGKPVPGVTIRVMAPGYSREVTTNDRGFYSVLGLPLGRLAVYAESNTEKVACPFYIAPIAVGEVKTLSFSMMPNDSGGRCHVLSSTGTFDPDQTQDVTVIGTD